MVYALEGSVAVAGAALSWLRDNIQLMTNVNETQDLAERVRCSGDVYFVPAFSGLYAPYWQQDARGYESDYRFRDMKRDTPDNVNSDC